MMKTNTTLIVLCFFMLQFSSVQASEMKSETKIGVELAGENLDLESPLDPIPCRPIRPRFETACGIQDFVQANLDDVGVNIFIESILIRLLDRACTACEDDRSRLSRYYLSAFSRYLGYIRSVDDECARQRILSQVSFTQLVTRRFGCNRLPPPDVNQDEQLIAVLDHKMGAIQDEKTLEEESGYLVNLLEEESLGHVTTVNDLEDIEARVKCRRTRLRRGSLSSNMDLLQENLEDLGTNVFVEGVLSRLLDGACAACEAGDRRRQSRLVRAFQRYLNFIGNVDRCDRQELSSQVRIASRFRCGDGPRRDVVDDQVLAVLDQELGAVNDAKSLEDESDHLIDLLDEVSLGHIATLDDLQSFETPIKCRKTRRLRGTICDNMGILTEKLEKLETNVFVEGVLSRLLRGACTACEAGNYRRQSTLVRAFQRYLGYIRNVDQCDRMDLQRSIGSLRPCRRKRPPADAIGDQTIAVLEQELGAIQDITSLEDQGEYLIQLLDRESTVRLSSTTAFTAFPNPTTSQINLSQVAEEVQVVSSTGQVLLTLRGVQELNVSHLSAGIYTLRVRDKQDSLTSLRIVKN